MADFKLNYDKSWLSNADPLPSPSSALPYNFGSSAKSSLSSFGNYGTTLLTGGLKGLFGGIFGNLQYKRQLRMMREQNAFQRRERELQNRWNLEQWMRENEYNSAKNQRARFQEAGLNPFLLMNGSNAGTASSLSGSSSGASAPSAPFYNPADGFDNMVNNALNREQQDALIKSNIYSNYANSAYTFGKNSREETALDSSVNANRAVAELNFEKSITEISQRYLNSLDAESKKILNKYLDPLQQQELAESIARVEKLGEELNLTKKEVLKATEELTNLKTQGRILKQELKRLQQTNDKLIAAENAESALREFTAKNEKEFQAEQAPDNNTNRYKARRRRDDYRDITDKTLRNKRDWMRFNVLDLFDEETTFEREEFKNNFRNRNNITKSVNYKIWKDLGLFGTE